MIDYRVTPPLDHTHLGLIMSLNVVSVFQCLPMGVAIVWLNWAWLVNG